MKINKELKKQIKQKANEFLNEPENKKLVDKFVKKSMNSDLNLERLRKKQKLTRIELAEILECHKQQIFNFEKGTSTIPLKYVSKLAAALKINQKELVDFIVKSKVNRLMKEVK